MAERALRPADYATWAVLGLGAVAMLLPFAWMLSTSFKTGEFTFVIPPQLIPTAPTIDNYAKIFAAVPMGIVCPLSGGRDSRILFLALASEGRVARAVTVADDEGDTYEEDLAGDVAEAVGVPQERLLGTAADYADEWLERARRVEFEFADHAWLVPVARRLEGSPLPVPDGFAIDVTFSAGLASTRA